MSVFFYRRGNSKEDATVSGPQGNADTNGINDVLVLKNILVNQKSVSKDAAIEKAGQLLVDGGYVLPEYIVAMKEREAQLTTYIGHGVAIPHGVGVAKDKILKSGISVIQYPDGIVFDEDKVAYLIVGIAGKGKEHLKILSNLAEFIIEEEELLKELFSAEVATKLYSAFTRRV